MSRDEAPFFVTLPHGDEGSELIAEREIRLRGWPSQAWQIQMGSNSEMIADLKGRA
jgi:hypothetical protein